MIHKLVSAVSSGDLAVALGLVHHGPEITIDHIASLSEASSGSLWFSTMALQYTTPESLVITRGVNSGNASYLESLNPRLDFIRALHWLIREGLVVQERCGNIHSESRIHPSAVIEPGAAIGPGCRIGPHVHLHAHVMLGPNIQIGSGTVIGHDGFGYERDETGRPIHFPHLGRVVVGEGVTIGNLCCISRGTLNDTIIGANVKIDDQAYIAHNVRIAENTLIMSGVRLNGGVRIGTNCWIGTGAMVREGRSVGDGALVGMGSVVVSSVGVRKTVLGNPGRETEKISCAE